jgi:hypothetical protein
MIKQKNNHKAMANGTPRREDKLPAGFTETHFTVGSDEGLFLGFKRISARYDDRQTGAVQDYRCSSRSGSSSFKQ